VEGSTIKQLFPPGHFYSPVPDLCEIRSREAEIFDRDRPLPGIDLRGQAQLGLFRELAPLAADLPFVDEQTSEHRYWFDNGWFTYGDAVTYALILRRFEPKRVVEIGCGFSSALLLDVNERFLGGRTECRFVEPNPERLRGLLRETDRVRVFDEPVQTVDRIVFCDLEENDILFVDSTHVAKTGSDVDWIFRELVPNLPRGVLVHFHDVFYPFEYPQAWVFEGRGWNEVYVIRSFLQFNDSFEIVLFPNYLAYKHLDVVAELCPRLLADPGASIWLRRTR
jgi:hypothetical protein